MTQTPIKVAFGWSVNRLHPVSTAIRYFSRPGWPPWPLARWSHMFLAFRSADGSTVIHEALLSQGWTEKPARKLTDWLEASPRAHQAEIHWLSIPESQVAEIYRRSREWLGTKSYAMRQIAAFALVGSYLGRYLGLSIKSGEEEVICSEGACQLVGEVAFEWDLRERLAQSWDSVSPQAAYDEFMRMGNDSHDRVRRVISRVRSTPCRSGTF